MYRPIRRRMLVAALAVALTAAAAAYYVHADRPGAYGAINPPHLLPFLPISLSGPGKPHSGVPDVTMSPIDTRILGQTTWVVGSQSALRVIVTDRRTGAPLQA